MEYPARYQFQAGAPCRGSSTCTDTCIQMIVEFYKDKTYSLSYIRKVAQAKTHFNENACTGLNYVEVLNGLRALGVTHYKVGWNVNSEFVYKKLSVGPVIVGVYYGSYPKNISKRCGKLNLAEISGKTDCGFRDAHAVLAIGKRLHKSPNGKITLHRDIYTRDPDHHSGSRPEAPKYDRIRINQLERAMHDLPTHTAFGRTYCIYPTMRK